MFRTILPRTSRPLLHARVPAVTLTRFTPCLVRLQSNQTQPPKQPLSKEQQAIKAAREKADDLQRDWDARVITYSDLKPLTENPTADRFLIDVREPDEVIQGMIPSAVNLPLSVLANALHLQHGAFRQNYGFDKPRKDQQLVFYCRSGVRSTTASDVAKRNGYTDILNYKGSWMDWVAQEGNTKAA